MFPLVRPKIKVSNQLVGSIIGSDVQLECRCEASPTPATSWIRHDGQVLAPSNKYQLREEHDSYKTKMKLKIMSLDEKDFGSYKCVAKNTIGEKEGLVRLYGKLPEILMFPYDLFSICQKLHHQHQRQVAAIQCGQPISTHIKVVRMDSIDRIKIKMMIIKIMIIPIINKLPQLQRQHFTDATII